MKLSLLAMVVVVACGSNTSIEQTWKAPGGHAALQKVATVMLWRDPGIRRTTEDQLAARLQHAGVNAVPAYTVLSPDDVKDPQLARQRLLQQGFDGAIVMRFVGQNEQVNYMPGYVGYWGGAYGGTMEVDTIIRLETAAYSLQDSQLVYSALSKTTDPDSIPDLISGATTTVAGALEKQHVVVASLPPGQPAG